MILHLTCMRRVTRVSIASWILAVFVVFSSLPARHFSYTLPVSALLRHPLPFLIASGFRVRSLYAPVTVRHDNGTLYSWTIFPRESQSFTSEHFRTLPRNDMFVGAKFRDGGRSRRRSRIYDTRRFHTCLDCSREAFSTNLKVFRSILYPLFFIYDRSTESSWYLNISWMQI